jgi:hypothetical protein
VNQSDDPMKMIWEDGYSKAAARNGSPAIRAELRDVRVRRSRCGWGVEGGEIEFNGRWAGECEGQVPREPTSTLRRQPSPSMRRT